MRCEPAQKQLQKYFLKILLKRVDHFLMAWLPECSVHEMWSSSKAAQKVFFKNLSEESKPLFGGAASRMFCTCDVKQLKMYFLKILLKRVKHFLKGPLVECSLHQMWSSSKSSTPTFLDHVTRDRHSKTIKAGEVY